MLAEIGSLADLERLCDRLPSEAYDYLLSAVTALNRAYGTDRDYRKTGGYSAVAFDSFDIDLFRQAIVDFDCHPCEYARSVGNDFISALFVMSNDFSVELLMPKAIAPEIILSDLEDLL